MRALVSLVALVSSARAELPTIDRAWVPAIAVTTESGHRIDRVALTIGSAPEPTFLTIDIVGRGTGTIALDVPSGTKIVGLGVDGVGGQAWGRAQPVANARSQLLANGGALLAWQSTSADQDHLRIDVSQPSRVELALHLPPLARLSVRAIATVVVDHVRRPEREVIVDLADVAGTTAELGVPHATETIALVAAPTPPADFALFSPTARRGRGELDKGIIRRRLTWFRPTLRGCYLREAQWDGANNARPIRGGAVLAFFIVEDGSVAWARATESDLPAKLRSCLVEQVLAWRFPQADGSVQVNYPISFEP